MKTSVYKIACIGECMVELSLGGAALESCAVGFAGDTFNTAIYLKRELADAARVSFVSIVGKDTLSDKMVARFEDEGLNIDLVTRHESRIAGLYAISTDSSGERSFTYWRDQSAAKTLFQSESGISFAQLEEFDLIYFSAITLAILPETVRAELIEWIKSYRANGGMVAFDSNYRPRLWSNVEAARHHISNAWKNCDIALPSADDEMALFGDENTEQILKRISNYGVTRGALKNGATGPLPFGDYDDLGVFAAAENVIDTTAAGDSFNGGYLAAIARGQSAKEAAHAGHNLACYVIGHRGAIVPRR